MTAWKRPRLSKHCFCSVRVRFAADMNEECKVPTRAVYRASILTIVVVILNAYSAFGRGPLGSGF